MNEEEFIKTQLKNLGKSDLRFSYTKVVNNQAGLDLVNNMHNLLVNDLNVIVYNFVDMLSHARTEMEVLKELAGDETSYRSITASWFEHSPLNQALKKIADNFCRRFNPHAAMVGSEDDLDIFIGNFFQSLVQWRMFKP